MLKKLFFVPLFVLIFVYLSVFIFIFPILKPYIERYISKTLNLKTEFESISYSFPCGLSFRHVVISDDQKPILISKELIFIISPISYLRRKEPLKYIKLNSPTILVDNIRSTDFGAVSFIVTFPKIKWNNGSIISKNKIIKCDGELEQKDNIISASVLIPPDIPLSARILLEKDTWIARFFSSYKGFNLEGKISGKRDPSREIIVNSVGEYDSGGVEIKTTLNGRIESVDPLVFFASLNVEGKILKKPVTLFGNFEYKDEKIRIDNFLISAHKFKIVCNGSYDGNRFYAELSPMGEKHPIVSVDYLYPTIKITDLRRKESLSCEFLKTHDKKLLKVKGKIAGFDTEGSISVSADGIYGLLCNLSKNDFLFNFEGEKYRNKIKFKSNIHALKTVFCLSGSLASQDKKMSGKIDISSFSLNGFEIKPITCDINYYNEKLIKNINSEDINGNIVVDIGNNTISGNVRYLLYTFSGKIDGTALISGEVISPKITFDYNLENIKYNTLTLSLSGRANILNGRLINRIHGRGSISGTISTNINGKIEIPNLIRLDRVNGNIKLTSVRYKNIKLDNITFTFLTDDKGVYFKNVKVVTPQIGIISHGRLYRNKLNLQMKINKFELPYILLYGTAELSCDFLQPYLQGTVILKDFWVNQYYIPKYEFSYKSYKGELSLRDKDGNLEISLKEKSDGKKILRWVMNKKNMMFNLDSLYFNNVWSGKFYSFGLDFQYITSLAGFKILTSGITDFSGSFKYIKGSLSLEMDLFIKQLLLNELLLGDVHLSFNYEKDKLKIKSLMITDENTEIKAGGTVSVKRDGRINFTIDISKFPLQKLKNLSELIEQADGIINGKISITGKTGDPLLYGDINITNGNVKFVKYIDKLKSINGGVRFKGETAFINISSLSDIKTKILIVGDTKLKGLKLQHCNINLLTKGRGIHLKIPEWPIEVASFIKGTPLTRPSYGEGSFNLNLGKKQEKFFLTGEISIANACFSYPSEQVAEFRLPDFLILDLKIIFSKKSWIRTQNLNMKIEEGYLSIKSEKDQVLIDGTIKSRHGSIVFLGNVFKIKYMEIEIIKNKPYIGLTAVTNVKFEGERQRIEMKIERAPLEMSKMKFTNALGKEIKPEKLFGDAIGLKAEMTTEERYRVLREQLVRLIDSSLTSPLARAVLQHLPVVDDVSISRETKEQPKITGEQFISMLDLLKGSKYTLEKYLTDELVLAYSMVVGELGSRLALKHQIEVAYRLRGNMYLIGAYELASGEIATTYIPERKIMLETHWRFGW